MAKREPIKIIVEVQSPRAAAPATVTDANPSPYARYNKGVYRVVDAGDQYSVEMWGDVTKAWKPMLRYAKADFRLEESPVEFMVFRITPNADATRDPIKRDSVADAIDRQNRHLAANPLLRERLEDQAARLRDFDAQRTVNWSKGER
jgi:hypothetical protein